MPAHLFFGATGNITSSTLVHVGASGTLFLFSPIATLL